MLKKLLDNELGKVTGGDSLDFVPYCTLYKAQYNPNNGYCDDFDPIKSDNEQKCSNCTHNKKTPD